MQSLCCKGLRWTVFTPEDAYTPNLLRQRVFSPNCLDQTTFTTEDVYTSKRLHQRLFALEAFYSRGTSHQRVFTPEHFTETFYTRGRFATEYVHAVHLLHQTSTVHQRVFTPKDFDTTKFYTRKLFRDEPQTIHTIPFLTAGDFDNKDARYTKDPLHQRIHQRPSTPESLFLHLVFTRFLFHQKILTSETFHKTLYTKSFEPLENFHKGNLLQQRLNKALHRTTLVLEALYTKEFSLQKAFTQTPFTENIFCTRNRFIKTGQNFIYIFLARNLCTKDVLALTLEALYTKEFSQQKDFTLDPFCAEQFLHQQPLNYTTGL